MINPFIFQHMNSLISPAVQHHSDYLSLICFEVSTNEKLKSKTSSDGEGGEKHSVSI